MPLKWPSLPYIVTKGISLVCFIGTASLKIWDINTLYSQFDSHCIAGWEITDKVGSHLMLIMLSLIPDMGFVGCIGVAMFMKTSNFGADPGAISYNFIVGILQLWSIIYIYVIEDCGNSAIPIIKSVSLLSLIAGILHFINALICFIFMAPEERSFPIRRPRSSILPEN
ncbi:uncharacterized protein LOC133330941 [Musca vetustissima]|uniref:uncharacterized protein LOC133330941 n=1 Tax=Musca vetustissima TaxID=27455 RepID=UPI002AB6D620|nr:uncharacterized protein LOC133330941 [Musca vetustissima]